MQSLPHLQPEQANQTQYDFLCLCNSCIVCIWEIVDRKDLSATHMTSHLVLVFRLVELALKSFSLLPPTDSEKFMDNLKLLLEVINHLITNLIILTSNQHPEAFSSVQFLDTFLEFSFGICKSDLNLFCEVLRIWSTHLEFIKTYFFREDQLTATKLELEQKLPAQISALESKLTSNIISSLLFSESKTHLSTLVDDVSLEIEDPMASQTMSLYLASQDQSQDMAADSSEDDDKVGVLSPFRRFFHETMLVLDHAAFLAPEVAFNGLLRRYEQAVNEFDEFMNKFRSSDCATWDNETINLVHMSLRDFSITIQAIGFLIYPLTNFAVTDHPQGDQFLPWFVSALLNVYNNIEILFYGTALQRKQPQLFKDCVELFSQILSTIHCLVSRGHLGMDLRTEYSENGESKPPVAYMIIENKEQFFISLFKPLNDAQTQTDIPIRIVHWLARLLEEVTYKLGYTRTFNKSPYEELFLKLYKFALLVVWLHAPFPSATSRVFMRFLVHLEFNMIKNSDFKDSKCLGVFFRTAKENVLSSESLKNTKKAEDHLKILCFVIETLITVEKYSTKQRNFLFNLLVETKILDCMVDCLIELLRIVSMQPLDAGSVYLQTFQAYMALFTILTRVFTYSKANMDLMPPLISRILSAFQVHTCNKNHQGELTETLLDILFLVVLNRSALPKLWKEVMKLALGCLLPTIADAQETVFDATEQTTIQLVCKASVENPHACRRLVRLVAFILRNISSAFIAQESEESEAWFKSIFLMLLSTMHPEQQDSQLVQIFLDALNRLYEMRRLNELDAFTVEWRYLICSRIMNLLVIKSHTPCTTSMIDTLHLLMVETGQKQLPNNERTVVIRLFIEEFLPAYLAQEGPNFDESQKQSLLHLCFAADSPDFLSSASNSPYCDSSQNSGPIEIPSSAGHLIDKINFQNRLKRFINDVCFYRSLHSKV
ncbi:hypothetical protein Ciccas_003309 [Cichlidogyrus casuarinus]|uniref:Uncharacterized protein n=1 Tax=Cichlidogyrus casuarinus TaxID=1844966 RepID=A0ABD2QER1_9PLAT